eukprot:gene34003-62849_t
MDSEMAQSVAKIGGAYETTVEMLNNVWPHSFAPGIADLYMPGRTGADNGFWIKTNDSGPCSPYDLSGRFGRFSSVLNLSNPFAKQAPFRTLDKYDSIEIQARQKWFVAHLTCMFLFTIIPLIATIFTVSVGFGRVSSGKQMHANDDAIFA